MRRGDVDCAAARGVCGEDRGHCALPVRCTVNVTEHNRSISPLTLVTLPPPLPQILDGATITERLNHRATTNPEVAPMGDVFPKELRATLGQTHSAVYFA